MTETYSPPQQRLLPWEIAQKVFGMAWRNFFQIALLQLLPTAVIAVFLAPMLISLAAVAFFLNGWGSLALNLALYAAGALVFSRSFIVMQDARAGRKRSIFAAWDDAINASLPLAIVGFVAYLGVSLGMVLLILPGLFLLTRWFVLAPAIIIEGHWFSAFGRSFHMTKGHFWQVFWTMVLTMLGFGIMMMILMLPITGLISIVGGILSQGGSMTSVLVVFGGIWLVFAVVGGGFGYAVLAALTLEIWSQLYEIKEGVSDKDMAEVFK